MTFMKIEKCFTHTEPNSASLTNIVTLLLLTKAKPPITTMQIHPSAFSSRIKSSLK
jgi:hypothetical protein